jgi:predicted neuraminidase
MIFRSGLQSTAVRAGAALLLVLWVLALDLWQRPAVPGPAQAVFSQAVSPVGNVVLDLNRLQPVAKGTIPMPDGALAAHASNLLAMPADHHAAVMAFWFAGDRESAPNVQIAASQFDRATQRWLPARYVINRHAMADALHFGVRRLGNPVAWLDASNRVHLFVVATGWGGWAASRILHVVQRGEGNDLSQLAFEPVRVLPLSWLWNTSFLVRNAPLQLADGGMVLPAHFEIGSKHPVALRFDKGGEFQGMVRLSQRKHLLQPTLLAQTPAHWIALMRDTRPDGRITAVQTQDGGQHWSDVPDLRETNPDAAVAGLTLAPGQSLLAHNTSPHSRELLDLSASANGLDWIGLQTLAHGVPGDEFSYPAVAWADDALWVSYTDHRRSIAWQRLAIPGPAPTPAGAKP